MAYADYTPPGPWTDGQRVIRNIDGTVFSYVAAANTLVLVPVPFIINAIQVSQPYTFNSNTHHALIFLWGGSAEFCNINGSTGQSGGDTTFLSLAANGGTGNSISGDGSSNTPGTDGSGSGGLVITGGGPSGGGSAASSAGRGGLVIGYLVVTPGSTVPLTVGHGGSSGLGIPGHPGGALILEIK